MTDPREPILTPYSALPDPPRSWTISRTRISLYGGKEKLVQKVSGPECRMLRVVELDRERFVPIIERALMDHERSTDYRLTAEDVFDAIKEASDG